MADEELRALFEEDQADRRRAIDPDEMISRDARRRRDAAAARPRPSALPAGARVGHASSGTGQPAGALAGSRRHDRWLMAGGLPQAYGTQYRAQGDRWVLHEVDPTTSDEERARWDVPPLVEALRRAEEMTRECPPVPPPRSFVPTPLRCGVIVTGTAESAAASARGRQRVRLAAPGPATGSEPSPR
jgi:hypothetical protein